MKQFANAEILEVYQSHPLRAETILARLRETRGSLVRATEADLAQDEATEITDQNHVGGLAFVKDLAAAAQISTESRVLDVGAGLGGSARALAYLIGCRVHGIELSEQRCRDAEELTRLVGLDRLVTMQCGDFLTLEPAPHGYDVVWGQSAWVHVQDKGRLIARAAQALRDHGRIALEDAYLKREPAAGTEQEALDALSYYWRSHIVSGDQWMQLIRQESLEVRTFLDLTGELIESVTRPLRLHEHGKVSFPEGELQGWQLGAQLAGAGLLGYFRLVAAKGTGGET